MNPPATQHATPDGHDWHELEVANPSFAVITRRAGRLSPGVRELITDHLIDLHVFASHDVSGVRVRRPREAELTGR